MAGSVPTIGVRSDPAQGHGVAAGHQAGFAVRYSDAGSVRVVIVSLHFTPAVTVSSLDARYRRGRHELRGQWSVVNISGAADLNRALQIHTGLSPNIASRLLGAYAEVATRVTPDSWSNEVVVFGRYEKFDTQNKMPAGYLPLQQFQRSAWVAGATYYPDPDVAFKFDFVKEHNKSNVVNAPWRINAGVGWWF